ncbi:hypothetical protein BKA82DRAFT_2768955 [Pisolithus tinctorius]|nr:hypothetical protein BKA82DRAFT_2768955 [Pisolithus tinctorius]
MENYPFLGSAFKGGRTVQYVYGEYNSCACVQSGSSRLKRCPQRQIQRPLLVHSSTIYVLVSTLSLQTLLSLPVCFTLCIVLFALSTRESRRRVVFRLNVFAICIVLTMGVLVGLTNGKAIVDPFNPLPTSVYFAGVAFSVFPPLPCDSILLTRLFALYPLGSTPLATLIKVFAFPLCIKCARVVVLTHFLINYVKSASVEGLTQDEATYLVPQP